MKITKLLAAGTFALVGISLLAAQQAGVTAQQSSSATAAGVNASQSTDAGASANTGRQHSDVNSSAGSSASGEDRRGSANASANGAVSDSAGMRQVTGQLENKLDTKTAKAGDQVVLKTNQKIKTAEGVVIPKGSRLIGHVTQVQAHSKEQAESHMALEFDRAELRGGQSMAIRSMIESIEPNPSAVAAASMDDGEMLDTPMGGGAVGGHAAGAGRVGSGLVGGAVGSATTMTGNVASGVGPSAGSAMRTTSNVTGEAAGNLGRGVNVASNAAGYAGARATGIQGVMLSSDAAGAASGTLSSANRNIHLDSGTQMVLGVAAAR